MLMLHFCLCVPYSVFLLVKFVQCGSCLALQKSILCSVAVRYEAVLSHVNFKTEYQWFKWWQWL